MNTRKLISILFSTTAMPHPHLSTHAVIFCERTLPTGIDALHHSALQKQGVSLPVSMTHVPGLKKKEPKPINTIPIMPPTQKGFVVLGLRLLFLGPVIVCDFPLRFCQSPHFSSAALPRIPAGRQWHLPVGLTPKWSKHSEWFHQQCTPNALLRTPCNYLLLLVCFVQGSFEYTLLWFKPIR